MKLVTFAHEGRSRVGVADGDDVVDLSAAAPELPTEMLAFLEGGDAALQAASAAVGTGPRIPLADVRLQAPIARPPKFLAVGLNYADHVAESGLEPPAHPTIFNKQSTCVTAKAAPSRTRTPSPARAKGHSLPAPARTRPPP